MPDNLRRSAPGRLAGAVLGALFGLVVTVSGMAAAQPASSPALQDVTLTLQRAHQGGPDGAPAPSEEALVVVISQADDGDAAKVVQTKLPGTAHLQLPQGSLWRVEVQSKVYWAAPVAVLAGPDTPPPPVELYLAGELTGRLSALPRGAGPSLLPPELEVSFQPVDPVSRLVPGPEGTSRCPLAEDGRWTCQLPAGTYDLRLHAEGFASTFRWQVRVAAGGSEDLGTLPIVPGSALFGFIESAAGRLDPRGVEVTLQALRPQTSDHRVGRRLDAMGKATGIDERGFFQFRDVIPGPYRIAVEADGFAPLRTPPVEVLPGLETDLARPLILQEAAQLHVWVSPPIHPTDDAPWTLRLQPRDLDQPAVKVDTDVGGAAFLEGLATGSYHLYVGGLDDARWEEREIELQPGVQTLTIELPIVPVEGTITRGGDPVRARITFGERRSEQVVSMVSDPQGLFRGCLPEEGEWPITLLFEAGGAQQALDPVLVERSGDGPAEVHVEVPDTWIGGRVVDADGAPVALADVEATRPSAAKPDRENPGLGLGTSYVRTDAEGRFHFEGLPEGRYVVEALRGSRSAKISVDVRDEQPRGELRIVLGTTLEVEGRVFTDRGPVAGAQVFGLPFLAADRSFAVAQAVTDPLGGFRLTIPQDTLQLTMLVLPYGHVPRLLSWAPTPGSDNELVIQVGDIGGTVVLAGPRGTRPSASAYLEHAGFRIPIMLLSSWLLLHGGQPAGEVPWVLPAMPVGDYRLCDPANGSGCDGGVLPPGGRLALQAAEPDTESAGGGREIGATADRSAPAMHSVARCDCDSAPAKRRRCPDVELITPASPWSGSRLGFVLAGRRLQVVDHHTLDRRPAGGFDRVPADPPAGLTAVERHDVEAVTAGRHRDDASTLDRRLYPLEDISHRIETVEIEPAAGAASDQEVDPAVSTFDQVVDHVTGGVDLDPGPLRLAEARDFLVHRRPIGGDGALAALRDSGAVDLEGETFTARARVVDQPVTVAVCRPQVAVGAGCDANRILHRDRAESSREAAPRPARSERARSRRPRRRRPAKAA